MKIVSGYVFLLHPQKTKIDVEQRELVMCKDCRYWQDNNGGYPHSVCKWRADETPDPDDFCSAGERCDG